MKTVITTICAISLCFSLACSADDVQNNSPYKKYTNDKYIIDLNKATKQLKKDLPKQIDDMTKLINVESKDLELTYTYSLDFKAASAIYPGLKEITTPEKREYFEQNLVGMLTESNINNSCSNEFLKEVLLRNGSINYDYYWKDTNEKFSTQVLTGDCAIQSANRKAVMDDKDLFDSAIKISIALLKKTLPITVDAVTSITDVSFSDDELFYEYTLDKEGVVLEREKSTKTLLTGKQKNKLWASYGNSLKPLTIKNICENHSTKAMLELGNSFKASYKWNNGDSLSDIVLSFKDCSQ